MEENLEKHIKRFKDNKRYVFDMKSDKARRGK